MAWQQVGKYSYGDVFNQSETEGITVHLPLIEDVVQSCCSNYSTRRYATRRLGPIACAHSR